MLIIRQSDAELDGVWSKLKDATAIFNPWRWDDIAKELPETVRATVQSLCNEYRAHPTSVAIAQRVCDTGACGSPPGSGTEAKKAADKVCKYAPPPEPLVPAPVPPPWAPVSFMPQGAVARPTPPPYPAGTVYYYDEPERVYRLAVPRQGLRGSGDSLYDLVISTVNPSERGAVLTDKADVEKKTGTRPFYKRAWFWGAVGGVAAVGGGALYFRGRR